MEPQMNSLLIHSDEDGGAESNLRPSSVASDSSWLIKQALVMLTAYLSLGILIYSLHPHHYSGTKTHPAVDALYFSIITLCTIGYGDIAPLTPSAKLFACAFVLVGFGFILVFLAALVNHVLDMQENVILKSKEKSFSANKFVFDLEKGRMRIRMKVGLALGVVVVCVGVGVMILGCVEKLSWVDSVYLSVVSVTTVGYGDRAFNTLVGRLLASFWLLFSTLAVGRAAVYLAEARIQKRQREMVKWMLVREITVQDLIAADINNNGFVRFAFEPWNYGNVKCFSRNSKSDFLVFKLKEMGKINEKDVLQICSQFNKLDRSNSGRITLPDLLESHR